MPTKQRRAAPSPNPNFPVASPRSEFPELEDGKLASYKLVLHCGACVIDMQKVQQRLQDLRGAGVPAINYGIFFSAATSPAALQRALEPWGVEVALTALQALAPGAAKAGAGAGGSGSGTGSK